MSKICSTCAKARPMMEFTDLGTVTVIEETFCFPIDGDALRLQSSWVGKECNHYVPKRKGQTGLGVWL